MQQTQSNTFAKNGKASLYSTSNREYGSRSFWVTQHGRKMEPGPKNSI